MIYRPPSRDFAFFSPIFLLFDPIIKFSPSRTVEISVENVENYAKKAALYRKIRGLGKMRKKWKRVERVWK